MENLFKYRLFGLNILSEPELPELKSVDFDQPDVKVIFSEVPDDIAGYTSRGPLYKAKFGKFLFKLDTVGKYLVENGELIKIERLNNSTDDEIRLFLLGSAFGALIHQRKLLPIHGSTVEKGGKAIILSGNSGAGKSTLAAVLIKREYKLVADDISVIDLENDKPVVYPGIPHLKLWQDVLKKLDDNEKYEKVRPQLLKFRKPVEKALVDEPVKAGTIIILGTKNSMEYEHREIKGMEKFNVLKNNTYRFQFVEGLGTVQPHFKIVSKLAGTTRVIQVKRPSSPLMLYELADYIEEKIL